MLKFLMHPPIIAVIYLLIGLGLHYFLPEVTITYLLYRIMGVIIIVVGLLLAGWALGLFKKKGTPKDPYDTPKALVTSGPYVVTRNPMYLGLTFLVLGIAFLVGSIYIFLAALAYMITINYYFIRREERLLEKLFEKEYLEYKDKVRRWL